MHDLRVAASVRAVRRRLNLRQRDVAARAHVTQTCISRIERGQLGALRVNALRRVASALEIDLPFQPRWRGGELARLLDAEHAALVERLTSDLSDAGWHVMPEYTFNHFGERGSVDLVGWHAADSALVLFEAKTRIVDVQELLSGIARKARIVPSLLQHEHGWQPKATGRLLALLNTSGNRRAIARHEKTFAAAFPERTVTARKWLHSPKGDVAAIVFLDPAGSARANASGGGARVRRSRDGARPIT